MCEKYSFLLPDDFLKTQICTECKKYLSCGPVKNYVTGEIRCGRCVKENDGGFISLYNKMFEDVFFPCINRFQGCNKISKFEDVPKHEKSCNGVKSVCPICEKCEEFTMLSLMDHFKIIHEGNVLEEPIFPVEISDRKHYLFCDYKRNQLYIFYVHYQNDLVCINASTPKGKQVQQRINIIQNGQKLYASNFLPCSELNNNLEGLTISRKRLNLNKQFYCRFEFTFVITPLHINFKANNKRAVETPPNYDDLPITGFPKIYRDKFFKRLFGENFLKDYVLTKNGRCIQDISTDKLIIVRCSFCENFFATAGKTRNNFFCNKCLFKICGNCNYNGIQQKCPKCERGVITRYQETARHYYLHFYCKFGCNRYFRAWELLQHEDKCELNVHKFLSDDELIKMYFDEQPEGNYSFYKYNSIIFDISKFSEEGKLYVVTRDGFRFILVHYYVEDCDCCQFRVIHKCNKEKLHILTKIYEENSDRECGEVFYISSPSSLTFFVVILRPNTKDLLTSTGSILNDNQLF